MSFSHLDPGTAEEEWDAAFRSAAVARADLGFASLLVVSAHPDDETLGVGGLMALAARRGAPVAVIVATDGEASHPDSPTRAPADLARVRREEVSAAVGMLAPDAVLEFLGIPDGALAEHPRILADAVRKRLHALPQPALVVSPWAGDGHRDHRIAAEAAAAVCRQDGAAYRGYPIWLWHWGAPADAPWERMERIALDPPTREAKRRATALHVSQTAAFSPAPGDEPVLHAGMQAHFDRAFEILIDDAGVPARTRRTPDAGAPSSGDAAPLAPVGIPTGPADSVGPSPGSTPRAWFERFYERNEDPWGFDSRWYEVRKRELLLASLPRQRYDHGLELGCSTGALTVSLAERCDALLAVDFAEAALEAAAARLGDRGDVELRRAELPAQWPEGTYDLIVLSELGYYWDAVDLEHAIGRMLRSLRPGGHLVACHWRHPVPAHPVTGDGVHVALRTQPDIRTLVHHEEEDFLLEVFGYPPARSVAAETGLLG